MKNTIQFSILILSCLLMNCRQKGDFKPQNHCKHEIEKDSVQILWTAFKFTERVSVKGHFDSIQVESDSELEFENLLKSTKIQFNIKNIQSNFIDRDSHIRQFFVPGIAQAGVVKGEVQNVEGNQALITLYINNISRVIPFDISVQKNILQLRGTLNLEDFQLQSQIKNLSTATMPMHTGSDGIPKMWPDLEIQIQTPIYSYCQ